MRLLCALCVGAAALLHSLGFAHAESSWAAPEQWAWSRLLIGQVADFDIFCELPAAQNDACRSVSPDFIETIAIDGPMAAKIPHHGIRMRHAVITGGIDLTNARVPVLVSVTDSRIMGDIDIRSARLELTLALDGTFIDGKFDGSDTAIGGNLNLEQTTVRHDLVLIGAEVGGFGHLKGVRAAGLILSSARFRHDLVLDDATIGDAGASQPTDDDTDCAHFLLCARGLSVDGQFTMLRPTTRAAAFLGDAEIHGDASFGGSSTFLMLDSMRIGGTLHMGETGSRFGNVVLNAAEVLHYWRLEGESVSSLSAQVLRVGQEAYIQPRLIDNLQLQHARFNGNLTISATVRKLAAPELTVDGTLRLEGAMGQRVELSFAHIGQDLTLYSAVMGALDLTNATVGGELALSDDNSRTQWQHGGGAQSSLLLVNAHVGAVRGDFPSWPPTLRLHGFTYNHLDGLTEHVSDQTISERTAGPYRDWLERDRYEPQPYAQLTTVLTAAGDRDAAAAIQYAARVHDTSAAWHDGKWMTAVVLTLLGAVAGYGIGDYTWRVMGWVVVFAVLGAIVIYCIPSGRARGRLWPVGASLENLLPYVRLDRSFAHFFEAQEEFKPWHKVALTLLGLAGSALGLFLAAAAAGLTQKG